MKDDLQIKIAASLVDTDAPENLSGKRTNDLFRELWAKRRLSHLLYGEVLQ